MMGLRKRARRADSGIASARMRAASRVVKAEQDGRAVLLDLRGERYFGLDESGTRFWAVLSEGRTVDETAGLLAEEYDAPLEQLRADTRVFAERMLEAGLLELA